MSPMMPRLVRAAFVLLLAPGAAALATTATTPQKLHGNYVFRPPAATPARGYAFFLGGAFVGAAPQLAYGALLQQLADAGYVVLATPFRLQFDYLELCDSVLTTAEPAHTDLVAEYGELPLVGVGHSCGALLHVLLSSVFRGTGGLGDVERAANCLVSFNNKPASAAIPFFGELVAPAASSVLRLENDPLLQPWRQAVAASRERLDSLVRSPSGGPSRSAVDLASQALPVLDQIEPILREIDGGKVEFSPTPEETRRAASKLYEARRTLVVRFLDDSLDESPPLPAVLQGGGDVRLSSLRGTHLTPLTPSQPEQPPQMPLQFPLPPLPTSAAASLAGAREEDFDAAASLILEFLDESIASSAATANGE